jgi:phage shock protein C
VPALRRPQSAVHQQCLCIQRALGAKFLRIGTEQRAHPEEGNTMDMSDELQKLHHLKEQGVLTEEEFAAAKKRVIDGEPTNTTGSQRTSGEPRPSALNEFRLSSRDRWLGGVCGGLAQQTNIPTWSWRILFVLLGLAHGLGVIVYALLWIFVPREMLPPTMAVPPPPRP